MEATQPSQLLLPQSPTTMAGSTSPAAAAAAASVCAVGQEERERWSEAGHLNPQHNLLSQAATGSVGGVAAALAGGAHVDSSSPGHLPFLGRAALHHAASKGHVSVVRFLVQRGANVNLHSGFPGDRGATPAHLAAENGYYRSLQVLLFAGANPDRPDADGRLPIHRAALRRQVWVLRAMWDFGCDLSAPAADYSTALHLAAGVGALNVARFLVEVCGVRPGVTDGEGYTALHHPNTQRHPRLVAYLREVESMMEATRWNPQHQVPPYPRLPLRPTPRQPRPMHYSTCHYSHHRYPYHNHYRTYGGATMRYPYKGGRVWYRKRQRDRFATVKPSINTSTASPASMSTSLASAGAAASCDTTSQNGYIQADPQTLGDAGSAVRNGLSDTTLQEDVRDVLAGGHRQESVPAGNVAMNGGCQETSPATAEPQHNGHGHPDTQLNGHEAGFVSDSASGFCSSGTQVEAFQNGLSHSESGLLNGHQHSEDAVQSTYLSTTSSGYVCSDGSVTDASKDLVYYSDALLNGHHDEGAPADSQLPQDSTTTHPAPQLDPWDTFVRPSKDGNEGQGTPASTTHIQTFSFAEGKSDAGLAHQTWHCNGLGSSGEGSEIDDQNLCGLTGNPSERDAIDERNDGSGSEGYHSLTSPPEPLLSAPDPSEPLQPTLDTSEPPSPVELHPQHSHSNPTDSEGYHSLTPAEPLQSSVDTAEHLSLAETHSQHQHGNALAKNTPESSLPSPQSPNLLTTQDTSDNQFLAGLVGNIIDTRPITGRGDEDVSGISELKTLKDEVDEGPRRNLEDVSVQEVSVDERDFISTPDRNPNSQFLLDEEESEEDENTQLQDRGEDVAEGRIRNPEPTAEEEVRTAEDVTEEMVNKEPAEEEVRTAEDVTEEMVNKEPAEEEVRTAEDVTEEMVNKEPAEEEVRTAEDVTEEMVNKEPAEEEVRTAEDVTEGRTSKEPAEEEVMITEDVTEGRMSKEPAEEEVMITEDVAEGRTSKEPAEEEVMITEDVTEGRMSKEPAEEEVMITEDVTEGRMSKEPAEEEVMITEDVAEGRTSKEPAEEEVRTAEVTEERTSKETAEEEVTTAEDVTEEMMNKEPAEEEIRTTEDVTEGGMSKKPAEEEVRTTEDVTEGKMSEEPAEEEVRTAEDVTEGKMSEEPAEEEIRTTEDVAEGGMSEEPAEEEIRTAEDVTEGTITNFEPTEEELRTSDRIDKIEGSASDETVPEGEALQTRSETGDEEDGKVDDVSAMKTEGDVERLEGKIVVTVTKNDTKDTSALREINERTKADEDITENVTSVVKERGKREN
ncbi:uncharacterized protein LOC135094915 [Scylla paramamosain]|uniref:uncharacterized protein LOC135094915 n=1 Tax=Scylla paramamosain TaxID=85552 RepID=UPI00308311E0